MLVGRYDPAPRQPLSRAVPCYVIPPPPVVQLGEAAGCIRCEWLLSPNAKGKTQRVKDEVRSTAAPSGAPPPLHLARQLLAPGSRTLGLALFERAL